VLPRRPRSEFADANPGHWNGADFHAWVRSLPWVVERPYPIAPGIRTFAVDCPPLGIRRVWLVTGLRPQFGDALDISVIVPREVSASVEREGWGRSVATMPADHVLMSASFDAGDASSDVEALVLTGYRYAMA
jgi:hypothetical protein